MFDIGGPEFLALIVLGLLLLGPRRLASVARDAGALVAKGKRLYRDSVGTLERELAVEEVRQQVEAVRRQAAVTEPPAVRVIPTSATTAAPALASDARSGAAQQVSASGS